MIEESLLSILQAFAQCTRSLHATTRVWCFQSVCSISNILSFLPVAAQQSSLWSVFPVPRCTPPSRLVGSSRGLCSAGRLLFEALETSIGISVIDSCNNLWVIFWLQITLWLWYVGLLTATSGEGLGKCEIPSLPPVTLLTKFTIRLNANQISVQRYKPQYNWWCGDLNRVQTTVWSSLCSYTWFTKFEA